ncbi:Predicted transport protein [Tenacibaculum sp. MAR_2009_124]|uniref:DUF5655 domain-containing protein n=1 Tax=Tenacibaculum sp. MAR_2009_124 TaxID=1250059 RepID=UPI000895C9DD|nr:DUF5655 domain-containing protein [Tenacibaculum sp. MAR_2009_124]SEC29297.1 Predicted transport protein [Tenacibaculum sp. MAR_2009_124]
MKLYQNSTSLKTLKEQPFKLEKEIQTFFEENMEQLLEVTMVKSEFTIKNKRIDTLAFDEQSKAFIIIEYKKEKNYSVVDQGFTYLSLMLENKADFILTYNETLGKTLHSKSVDWSQTRVVFVSPHFTENQKQATNFKDIAIELYEVKRYEGNIIGINPIKKTASATSIKPLTEKNQELQKISREIKVYTEEFHLERYTEATKELYEAYKQAILNLSDSIETIPKKQYIAFKKGKNIVDIVTMKSGLKLFINLSKGTLNDTRNITRDVSNIGHWGNGDYEIVVKDTKDLEYIMFLVKQAII